MAVKTAATYFFKNLYEKAYRRHSALRTIKGGICWGLSLRRLLWEQLLLLGYQRRVNNSIFKGCLYFFNFPGIADFSLKYPNGISTPPIDKSGHRLLEIV